MGMIQLPKQFSPDFAVPGKKPVGPVEIDNENSLGLVPYFALVMNEGAGAPSDLARSIGVDLASGLQQPFWGIGERGVEWKFSPNDFATATFNLSHTNKVTVVCDFYNPTSGSDDDLGFEYTVNANSNNGFFFDPRYSGGTDYHTSCRLGAGQSTRWPDPGVGWHRYIFQYGGAGTSQQRVWVDGVEQSLTYVANSSLSGNFANATLHFASRAGTSLFGEYSFANFFLFDHWLTDGQAKALSEDPYQLLKPVNAPVYFPAAAAGGGITGTADFTLAGLTTTSSGDVDISGTSDITLDALTTTSAGSVDIEGTSNITFDSLTVTGQGAVGIEGTSDITFDALTTTGQGFVGNPPAIGTADFTLAALTTTSLGTVDVSGTFDNTFDALTTTTAGSVDVEGTSSNTFDGLSLSSSGSVAVEGTSSNTFADLTLVGQGTTATIALGTADFTFDGLTVTSVGDVAVEGTSNANLDSLTTTTNATVSITGTSSSTFDSLTLSGAASGASVPRIDGVVSRTINSAGGSLRVYFNGSNYFII